MAETEIIRKVVDAFNRHDAVALAAVYAEDAVVYDPYYPEPLRGRAAIEKDMADFFRAFPDIHNSVKLTMSDGSTIAIQFAMAGRHDGPLLLPTGEIPPTGKRLESEGGVFSRLNSQGQIVEEHRYYDVLGQMTQLGIAGEQVGVA